ncbi:MAG: alpha/beta hydrolase [Thermodesulfobacteriota bacterium]
MDWLINLLILGVLGYGTVLAFIYFYQGRLLYYPDFPSRQVETLPSAVGLPYESVRLITGDTIHLDGWFIPVPEARGVILFCHGNAGNISHRLDSLLLFHKLGFSCLIFDYRGYGRSQGSPSEAGTYLDVDAAWKHLVESRGVAPERIVLFGRSLGAAVAAHQAAKNRPAALILESSFTSVPDMAAQLYPFLPARWLSRFDYDVRQQLQKIDCPLLVVHSRDDEIIPFSHGRALFAAARKPKDFLEIQGGHNEGFLVNSTSYSSKLEEFLSTWVK